MRSQETFGDPRPRQSQISSKSLSPNSYSEAGPPKQGLGFRVWGFQACIPWGSDLRFQVWAPNRGPYAFEHIGYIAVHEDARVKALCL